MRDTKEAMTTQPENCPSGMHDPQSDAERIAMEGLNVCGYAGKWKVAKELAEKNERSDGGQFLPYWERVRLLFLELGGQYVGQ